MSEAKEKSNFFTQSEEQSLKVVEPQPFNSFITLRDEEITITQTREGGIVFAVEGGMITIPYQSIETVRCLMSTMKRAYDEYLNTLG